MVVYNNKRFITNSEHPNDDWVGDADWVVPDGSELAEKIKRLYPNFDFVFDDTNDVTDVIETPPEPLTPEQPSKPELAAAIAELAEVMFCG